MPGGTLSSRAAVGALLVLAGAPAWGADDARVAARSTYVLPDGLYVNVGSESGLATGQTGQALDPRGESWRFEVAHAARHTALLRFRGPTPTGELRDRDLILIMDETLVTGAPGVPEPNQVSETPAFVPLLTPVRRRPQPAHARNVGHGRLDAQQLWQQASDSAQSYGVSRLGSAGSLERIEGSAWSAAWSGRAVYRTGQAYRRHADYQEVVPTVYRAALSRPLGRDGFVRAGRFLPQELPAIGTLDGIQTELGPEGPWRFGLAGGLRPETDDLAASAQEPSLAGYATWERGRRGGRRYAGTLGLLSRFFRGRADRVALLWDQRGDWGPRTHLTSTLAVDLGVADTSTAPGPALTRLDLVGVHQLTSILRLRAGVDHWQRPDTQAERSRLGFDNPSYFDRGTWRSWVGAQQDLGPHWRLSQEVASLDSAGAGSRTHWRAGAARQGLGDWPEASLRATLFNLDGEGLTGYGLTVSGFLPWAEGRWSLQPALGLRWTEVEARAANLSVTYLTLRVDGRVNRAWSLYGGVTPTLGDDADAMLLDLGLRYRW